MAIDALLTERINRIDSIPEAYFISVNRAEKEVFTKLIELLNQLERRGGNIIISSKNLELIDQIGNQLQTELFLSGYTEATTDFIKEFDSQADISKRFFKKTFSNFTDKELFANVVRASKLRAIGLLGDDAVGQFFTNQIKDILDQSIKSGAGFGETVRLLRTAIEGDAEREALYSRHVKRVARDLFAINDRTYSNIISEDLGIVWFQYLGGTVKDSRDFCIEREEKIFHINEIKSWGGEDATSTDPELLLPKNGKWQGRSAQTNTDTIIQLLGGYNCMHILAPVAELDVPKIVIDRAKELGFLK